MYTNSLSKGKTTSPLFKRNTAEIISDVGTAAVDKTVKTAMDVTTGMLDQFFGNADKKPSFEPRPYQNEQRPTAPERKKANVFSFSEYRESEMVPKQIEHLQGQILRDAKVLEKAAPTTSKEAQKLVLQISTPEKSGVYLIRLLEGVMNLLRAMRIDTSRSGNWSEAMQSKKKKRGSAFAVRSKSQGTQYSQSQELTNARSIQ